MGRADTREQDRGERVLGYNDFDVRLGDEMRGRRATLGKTLQDVEDDLHIRATHVDAIERADPHSFEVSWVIPGYVRSYARYLGMDSEDAYSRFCKESCFELESRKLLNGKVKNGRRAEKTRKKKIRRKIMSPSWWPSDETSVWKMERLTLEALGSTALLAAAGVAIIYFGVVFFGEVRRTVNADIDPSGGSLSAGIGTSPADALDSPGTEAATAEAGKGRVFVPGAISAITPDQVGMYRESGSTGSASAADILPDEPAVDLTALSPEGSGTDSDIAIVADATDIPAEPEPEPAVPAPSDQVILVPLRESWIRVTDELATTYAEGLLQVGEIFEIPPTDARPLLRAGNSGWLFFYVGGVVFGPAGNGGEIISDVDVTPGSIRTNYPRLDQDSIPQEIREIVRSSIEAGQTG